MKSLDVTKYFERFFLKAKLSGVTFMIPYKSKFADVLRLNFLD